MCTGKGIISNYEKCSYYVILKRIRTPIIGKMIIPISLINSDMEAGAKDTGRLTEAVMDSHECWNQVGLMLGNLMLDNRWEVCSEAKVDFSPDFTRLCKTYLLSLLRIQWLLVRLKV